MDSKYSEFHYMNPTANIFLNSCTFSAGSFGFQVVTAKYLLVRSWGPSPGFEQFAVPFYPEIPDGISWPLPNTLNAPGDFDRFAARWRNVYDVQF